MVSWRNCAPPHRRFSAGVDLHTRGLSRLMGEPALARTTIARRGKCLRRISARHATQEPRAQQRQRKASAENGQRGRAVQCHEMACNGCACAWQGAQRAGSRQYLHLFLLPLRRLGVGSCKDGPVLLDFLYRGSAHFRVSARSSAREAVRTRNTPNAALTVHKVVHILTFFFRFAGTRWCIDTACVQSNGITQRRDVSVRQRRSDVVWAAMKGNDVSTVSAALLTRARGTHAHATRAHTHLFCNDPVSGS